LLQWACKGKRVGEGNAAPPKPRNGPSLVAHERLLESDLSEITESRSIEGHRQGNQPFDANAGYGWPVQDLIRNRVVG
jgi:hypothetical protein